MERDDVWRAIDAERLSLADLFDDLTAGEWAAPSLCPGWRVRDVAAHLTLATSRPMQVLRMALRARGNFNRMILLSAREQAELPVDSYAPMLRAMVGSRRKAPGVTHLEPLLDALVHGQDIAIPLRRPRPMPLLAAAAAADRVWSMGWPFHARRTFAGFTLAATDHPWTVGRGERIEGPLAMLLLLITGRRAALSRLSGPGREAFETRTAPPAR